MRMEKTDFIEYTSEIAHKILYYSYKGKNMYQIDPETDDICYTAKAQDVFNDIHDDVEAFLAERIEVKDESTASD